MLGSVVLVFLMMTDVVCQVHQFKVLSEHLRQCRHSGDNASWLLLTFLIFVLFTCLQVMVYVVSIHTYHRPSILVDFCCLLAFLGWATLVHFDHSKQVGSVSIYPEKMSAIAVPVEFSMHTYGVLLLIISLSVILSFVYFRYSQFCCTQASLHNHTEDEDNNKPIEWTCKHIDTARTSKTNTFSDKFLRDLLIIEGFFVICFLIVYWCQQEFLYTTLEYIVIFVLYIILSVVFYVGIEMPYNETKFPENDGYKVLYLIAAFIAVALVPVSQRYA